MIREVLSHYHLPLLSCVGLLLFLAVFGGVCFWVFRRGSHRYYETAAMMPIEGELCSPTCVNEE